MALPDEIKRRIEESILPSIPNCLLCGHKTFHLNDNFYAYQILHLETKEPITEKGFPVILIDCANCFYTFSFSAKRAGLID